MKAQTMLAAAALIGALAMPAVAQEADGSGWHGWAWATCDGGEQYRVSVAGRAPVPREIVDVQRRVVSTARLGGKP